MEWHLTETLGNLVVGKYKSVDPLFLEGPSNNLLYDPVKYRIVPISNLVSCMVNIGSWSVAVRTSSERAPTWNEDRPIYEHAYGKIFINSIKVYCQGISVAESANRIGRGIIVSGDAELAFIKRNDIESEFGTIIDIANDIFVDKEYQTETELLVDPESEEWETLLFHFYLSLTTDEFMKYQRKLMKQFVSKIEPTKRIYFSLIIEPV